MKIIRLEAGLCNQGKMKTRSATEKREQFFYSWIIHFEPKMTLLV